MASCTQPRLPTTARRSKKQSCLLFFSTCFVVAELATHLTAQAALTQLASFSGSTNYGASVSMAGDGTSVVVGSPGDVTTTGYAEVRGSLTSTPSQELYLTGPGTDLFGAVTAVSADGSVVAVGDRQMNSIKVMRRGSGGTWSQLGGIILCGTSATDFGQSVALSADGLIIAVGFKISSNYRGYARVLQ